MKKTLYSFLEFEKKLLLSNVVLLIAFSVGFTKNGSCQTPPWLWARNASATTCMEGASGYSLAIDKNQNIFECGKFDNVSITFGSYTLVNANGYKNADYEDIFLAKYDANGNVLWAKSAGGTLDDGANCVATDRNGSAYIAGWFRSTSIVFGLDTLLNPNSEVDDVYIAKYDANGNVLWARSPGGNIPINSSLLTAGLATDASGNAYLLGSYNSPTIIFGSDTLVNVTNNNYGTIFIVKYDASGHVIWARNGLTSGAGEGSSIALDSRGNIYISGWIYGSTATFGSDTIKNPVLGGDKDVFVAKYDNSGNFTWVRNAYSYWFSEIGSATDSLGNTFAVGNSDSPTLAFGTDTVAIDYKNGFLFKFDSSGNVLWAKNMICTAGSGPTNVAIAPHGDIYLSGIFYKPYIAFSSDTLTNLNYWYNLFLTKYDRNGSVIWATTASSTAYTGAYTVVADDSGNAYITGNFSDTLIFGSDTLNSYYSTVFLAKTGAGGITGISQLFKKNEQIKAYPNPSNGVFQLEITNYKSGINNEVEIYNVLGAKVYSTSLLISNSSFLINLSNQPNGIYLYRVITETGNLIGEGKVVIAK